MTTYRFSGDGMTQHEDDNSAPLARMKSALGLGEFRHSGGRLHSFREGWAVDIWAFGRAHYWTRDEAGEVNSRCGLVRPVRNLWGAGNVQRCRRCEARRIRRERG